MGIYEVRRENVIRISEKYPSDKAFCEAAGVDRSWYSQVKTGRKNLGNKAARKIEVNLGLRPGTLDKEIEAVPSDPLGAAFAIEQIVSHFPLQLRSAVLNLVLAMDQALKQQETTTKSESAALEAEAQKDSI